MILFTDGASRGNPGPSGIGFLLFDGIKKILDGSYYLGNATNNIAEIEAILISLYIIKKENITKELIIKSDSLLLINQFKGLYKIKNERLKIAHLLFKKNFADLNIFFIHIEREYNKEADLLANKGIDEEILLPEEYCSFVSPIFNKA
jgi:ribonuclease HI